jgi:hypothetical protein
MAYQNPIEAEKAAGREAARELAAFIRGKHKSLFEKHSGRLQKVGYGIRTRNHFLTSVSAKTVKYAYVQHFGVDKTREAHGIKSHKAESKKGKVFTRNSFIRKAHPFKLKAKNHLEIPPSIVEKLANKIGEIRADEVLTETSKLWPKKA